MDDENEQQDGCRDRAAGEGMMSTGACVVRDVNAIEMDRGVDRGELIVDLDDIEFVVDAYDILAGRSARLFRSAEVRTFKLLDIKSCRAKRPPYVLAGNNNNISVNKPRDTLLYAAQPDES